MFSDEISVKNPDLTAATTTVNIEETSKFPNFKDGVTCTDRQTSETFPFGKPSDVCMLSISINGVTCTDRQTSETFRFRKPSDVCMPSVSFLIHQLERRTGIRNFSNWKTIGCL